MAAETAQTQIPEARTRVSLFLPCTGVQQTRAVLSVIRYLQQQRRRAIPVTGFTQSQFPSTVFTGFWWEDERRGWKPEGVVLFIIDYVFDQHDRRFQHAMHQLRRRVDREYEHYGSAQRDVWIIAQPVLRYTSAPTAPA